MNYFAEFRSAVENNDHIQAFNIWSVSDLVQDQRFAHYVEYAFGCLGKHARWKMLMKVFHAQMSGGTIEGLKALFGCDDYELLIHCALPHLARNHKADTVVTYGGTYLTGKDAQFNFVEPYFRHEPTFAKPDDIAIHAAIYDRKSQLDRGKYGRARSWGATHDGGEVDRIEEYGLALEHARNRLLATVKRAHRNKQAIFSLYALVYADEVLGMFPCGWKTEGPYCQLPLVK